MHRAADIAIAEAAAVHSLDRFKMAVPDLDQAHHFYQALGLTVEREREHLFLRTLGSDHIWGEIVAGRRKVLLSIRFGIYERDLPVFRTRFPDGANPGRDMISIRAPDGLAIELAVALKSSPDAKPPFVLAHPFAAD